MIRRSQLSLDNANALKTCKLDLIMAEALRVLNVFVEALWEEKRFHGSFTKLKADTWLSARMQQCLGKQALEAVKSQRKRRKKTMPVLTKPVLNLDQRFLDININSDNEFDVWIKLGSIGAKTKLNLPARRHKHFNAYVDAGWELKKSARLRKSGNCWFLDLYFEKEAPKPGSSSGSGAIGVDCGYKKLLATSRKTTTGHIENLYEKIARKSRGSKAHKRALTERDNAANRAVNELDLSGVGTIVVERLRNVKKGTKGKLRKQFNNKLQYWSYRKCFAKIQSVCEEQGIYFVEVDPAYTSQTCSACGLVDRNSRQGELFRCTGCGMSMDADINASINILMRGVYSPPSDLRQNNLL